MRVKLDNGGKTPYFGELVGLVTPSTAEALGDHTDYMAVVRCDGFGMMLHVVHPSRVQPVTPEQEADYK